MALQNPEMTSTTLTTADYVPMEQAQGAPSEVEIQEWLAQYLGEMLDLDADEINLQTSFARYGLGSSGSISLCAALGDWLGRELDPSLTYSYPTIQALAAHLVA